MRRGEPEAFITRGQHNFDKRPVREVLPQGNTMDYTYDEANPDRFQQGNIIRVVRTPDETRGGDQTALITETIYEPIYQQPTAVTDSRGLDPAFVPPVSDPSRPRRERYTTRYFFDYQEGDAALVLPLLAAELGTTMP